MSYKLKIPPVSLQDEQLAIDTLTDTQHRAALYPIFLTDYDPEWKNWYEDEKEK